MYAIFKDGSRQYKASEGDVIELAYRDAEVGSRLEFDLVLACGSEDRSQIGRPTVPGAKVVAEVTDILKGKKLHIQKFRRRKTYRKLTGHRQPSLQVQVREIRIPAAE